MGRREIITDDLSGIELVTAVEPTVITVDGTDYEVDLGEKSKAHLLAWLSQDGPYNYRTAVAAPAATSGKATAADKERTKAVRAWAIENKVKQPNGNLLGDRGRIPDEIYKAYDEANA